MKSMTGFGSSVLHEDDFDIELEIKSVNNRFLDLKINSPRELQFLDNPIKEIVSRYIIRGKVEIRINFNDKRVPDYRLDEKKLLAYKELLTRAKELINDSSPIILENILSQPDVLSVQNPSYHNDEFKLLITKLLIEGIERHQVMANEEGKKLQAFFQSAYTNITESLDKVQASLPYYKEKIYQDLIESIKKLMQDQYKEDFEKRIMLEAAFYLDKADITEETIRLKSHLSNFLNMIAEDSSEVGKSLNFVFQEMQREINTISAKYNTSEVFNHILLMKEEIERCREQIQNVE